MYKEDKSLVIQTELSLRSNLFQLPLESKHVNIFDSYEGLPRFTSPKHQLIERGDNGLALNIDKTCLFNGIPCILEIQPATIKDEKTGKQKSIFPYTVESKVQAAVYKIASENYGLELDTDGKRIILLTSINRIATTLQKANGTKRSPYNHEQIKQALKVLTKTVYELKSTDKNHSEMVFSLFENYKSVEQQGQTTIQITFNEFVSREILASQWRRIDFSCLVRSLNPEMASIYTLLYSRFTFASEERKPFNIKYSTLKTRTSIKEYSRPRDTMKALEALLLEMKDIIDHVEKVSLVYAVGEKGRRVLTDFTFLIYPTEKFIKDQINNNAHHKQLRLDVHDMKKPKVENY